MASASWRILVWTTYQDRVAGDADGVTGEGAAGLLDRTGSASGTTGRRTGVCSLSVLAIGSRWIFDGEAVPAPDAEIGKDGDVTGPLTGSG